MRFPSPKQVVKNVNNKEARDSVNYLIQQQQVIQQYKDIEDFILRDEEYTTNTNTPPGTLNGCEHHLLNVRNILIRELRARNFFIGISVLEEVLFQNFKRANNNNPIISTLESIRDAGVLRAGFVVYPLHSLGVIYGGILKSYAQASIEFHVPDIDIIVTPQTNSFRNSLEFIQRASAVLGIKKNIPIDLIEHWHRSRSTKWIEKNPLLIARIHSYPGDYYENQFFISNKLKLSTTLLLMLNSFQDFHFSNDGYLLSSSRSNNWETLDIKHYFLFYPRAHSNSLTGDCIPMNLSRPILAELSEVQAELDPQFWKRRSKVANKITKTVLNIESGYYRYVIGKSKARNKATVYRKVFKSLEFLRRSYRKKDDPGEAVVNLAVAFEILLTDSYSRGVTAKIINRVKTLLRGVSGVRKFTVSVEKLFEFRGQYVHTGFIEKANIKDAQVAYIMVLMNFCLLLNSIPVRGGETVARMIDN
jgi:hypothetical protein